MLGLKRHRVSLFVKVLITLLSLLGMVFSSAQFAFAQPTYTINYQGKLTDTSGLAVPDGTYNMRFWLLTSDVVATTSAVWTETRTGADKVTVTNGLFSVMLGEMSSLASVNFNQTLYLGVEVGGSGSVTWDGEMLPRKQLGTVPSAFEAKQLGGVASSSFLRSDQADALVANTATTLLTIDQSGSGNLLDLINSSSNTIFTALNNGSIGIGTTTPGRELVVDGDVEITGGLYDNNNSAGTLGQILMSTNGGFEWTATSTLGLLAATNIDTCAEFAAVMAGETGTCGSLVLSNSPAITGTLDAEAGDFSGHLTLSGTAANLVLGSNYINGDSGDEGISIDTVGRVSVTTNTGSVAQPLTLINTSTAVGAGSMIEFQNSATGNVRISQEITSAGNSDLYFTVRGSNSLTERMRLTAAGNLGVGTSTPSQLLNLFSSSNPQLLTNESTTEFFRAGVGETAGTSIIGWDDADTLQLGVYDSPTDTSISSLMAITAAGNVGIGTSTPTSKVYVQGGNVTQVASGNPTVKGSVAGITAADGVFVSGKYAYVPDQYDGLTIVDVSNPASPVELGTYNTSGMALGVHVVGKYAYVADYDAGLHIIDVSNPNSPTLVGTFNTTGEARNVFVSGKYAYIAGLNSGLQILDVSDPTAPFQVKNIGTGDWAIGVYVSGKYAYVAAYGSGLRIIDISNPSAPVTVGTYDTTGLAHNVYVSGKYAYVSDGTSGLHIINVSNPASPTLTGTYDSPGTATQATVAGRYAYLADHTSGVAVVDVSTPASPTLVGSYNTAGEAREVFLSGKYLYTADYTGGLQIFDINGTEVPTLLAGSVEANVLNATEHVIAGGDIFAQGGLGVGISGIHSRGIISAFIASTTQSNPMVATFMGGSVGIGTTTASQKLTVHGTNPQTAMIESTTEFLRAGVGETAETSVIGWDDSDALHLGVYDSPTDTSISSLMTITSAGNVGIGSTTPWKKFSVTGEAAITSTLTLGAAGVSIANDGDGAITFLGLGNGSDEDLTLNLDDTANTGVFTSSTGLNIINFSGITLQESGSNVLSVGDLDTCAEFAALGALETGTCGSLVLSTSPTITTPTFTTSATVPLIIGGSATSQQLILRSSSGNATTDDIIMQMGNNGATQWFQLNNENDAVSIGENAGATIVAGGIHNVALGTEAGRYASSTATDYNVMLGYQAGFYNTSYENNIIGRTAGYKNTGSGNNLFGYGAGYTNTGSGNNFFGNFTGSNNTGSNNIFSGTYSGQYNTGTGNVGMGSQNVGYNNTGDHNIMFAQYAGQYNQGDYNNILGSFAGMSNRGDYNNILGYEAGYVNRSDYSEFIGYQAGKNLNATTSIAIGAQALYGDNSGGTERMFSAINNVALGYRAGYNATNSADNNILIGYQAADNLTTGNNNIIIGYDIDSPTATVDNILNIGNIIFGAGIDSTGTTVDANATIGIGTSTPWKRFSVAGDVHFTGAIFDSSGDAGTNGQVLLSTGTGMNWVSTSSLGISGGGGLASTDIDTYSELNTIVADVTLTHNGLIDTSAEIAGIVGDETGSGALVFGTQPTFTNYINVGSAGVRISDDGDGAITFLGMGNGSDENLTLNLDDTANTGVFTSSTGLNQLTFTSIGLDAEYINTTIGATSTFDGDIAMNTVRLYSSSFSNPYLFIGQPGFGGGNISIGGEALPYAQTYTYPSLARNTVIGSWAAGVLIEGTDNTAIGDSSLGMMATGTSNTAIGQSALNSLTVGYANTALGVYAGGGILDAGITFSSSTFIGYGAGYNATTSADGNILIGYQAADNLTTGNNNIIIGYDIDAVSATADNKLNIGNLIFGHGLDGTGTTLASGGVSIGTTSERARLTVTQAPISYGAELITNGTFTGNANGWTLVADCSEYGSNKVTVSLDAGCQAGAYEVNLQTDFDVEAGTTYKITFTISDVSGDAPYIDLVYHNKLYTESTEPYQNGTHTIYFTASTTATETLFIESYNYTLNGTWAIDNVSVVAVDETPALAVTTSEGAALFSINQSLQNISFGRTGFDSNNSFANTLMGYEVGSSITTGSYNSLFGTQAGYSNSTGASNTFMGYQAGYSNVNASSNIFIGAWAGYNNDSAGGGSATANVFIGNSAGYANTTGRLNTFIGNYAGDSNTTGEQNLIMGASAGQAASTAWNNTFLGFEAGWAATGGFNTFVGSQAGDRNTTGHRNVYLGASAGFYNQAGTANIAIGYNAGDGASSQTYASSTIIGYGAGLGITTGGRNLLLGYQAGDALTTGANNIVIGYDIDATSNTGSNQLNIGNIIIGTGVNTTGTTIDTDALIAIGDSSPDARFDVDYTLTATAAATSYGTYFTVTDTGVVTTGTDTTYGNRVDVTRSGATGGTLVNYGGYTSLNGTFASGSGTLTNYGQYITVTGSSAGASTNYGLYVNVASADTNYAGIFTGGNVGIGTTTPEFALNVYGTDTVAQISGAGWHTGLSIRNLNTGGRDWRFISTSNSESMGGGKLSFYDASGSGHLMVLTSAGRLGIGTTSPWKTLSVSGDAHFTGALFDSSGDAGTNGQVLLSTGTGMNWVATSSLGFGSGGGDFYANGSVAMTDTMVLAQGVLGTGGFSFASDADTGIYRSGADAMVVTAGGIDMFEVGAGYLDMYEDAAFLDDYGIVWGSSETNRITGVGGVSGSVSIYTANTNRLHVNYAGNIGIGTTTPSSLLTTYGTNPQLAAIESSTEFLRTGVGETAGTSVIGWDDTDSLRLGVYDSPYDTTISSLMTILSSGNVGIGTTTPNLPLVVTGAGTAVDLLGLQATDASGYSSLDFFNNTGVFKGVVGYGNASAVSPWANNVFLGTQDSGTDIMLFTNTIERMRIDGSTGNVGIGTSSPVAMLTVVSSVSDQGIIRVEDPGVGQLWLGDTDNSGTVGELFFYGGTGMSNVANIAGRNDAGTGNTLRFETGGVEAMRITSAGNLGIGSTTPYAKLTVTNSGSGPSFLVEDAASPDTTPFVVDANGNVGIGDITPDAKFDVEFTSTSGTGATEYGSRFDYSDTGGVIAGTDTSYGIYNNFSRTSGTEGTYNNYAGYINMTGTALSGNINNYGQYISVTGNTLGTSVNYGLYVTVASADTNYAAIFSGGNVGIGDTTPTGLFTVGNGDLFTIDSTGIITSSNNISPNALKSTGQTDEYCLTYEATGTTLEWASCDSLAIGASISSATQGSIFFAGASGVLAQDNAQFFWDDSNNRLGIGTTTPNWQLQIASTNPYLTLTDTNASAGSRHLHIENDGGVFKFGTSSDNLAAETTSFTYNPSGAPKIGIGTSTPWRSLSVVGTVALNGLAAVAGTDQSICIDPTTFEITTQAGDTCAVSAARFKHDIEKIEETGLDMIMKLDAVSYYYNEDNTNTKYWGLIADQAASTSPQLAYFNADGSVQTLNTFGFLALFTKSIQELNLNLNAISSSTATTTPASLAFKKSFFERVAEWLGDKANGIKQIYAKKIQTDRLCVGNVCVDEETFLEMVEEAGQTAGAAEPDPVPPPPDPEPTDPESTPEPDPEPQPNPTPAPEPEPQPEPAPESGGEPTI